MVKKVEAYKAWDGTVHVSHDEAIKYEFKLALETLFENNCEPSITGPQFELVWKHRAQLSVFFMPNILENADV
jgi:hypothetical protein